MKNFQCKKCYTIIQQEKSPESGSCKESMFGHIWENLSNVGEMNYECSKCSIIVKSDKQPESAHCKESWIGHSWEKM